MTITKELSFEKHMQQIYVKGRAKLKTLTRITPVINIQKKKVLMKTFLRLNLAIAY